MATLNLEPAISTRYRIERVMYRGRCGIEDGRTGSHTRHCSTANSARARLVIAMGIARCGETLAKKVYVGFVSSTARSEQIFVV